MKASLKLLTAAAVLGAAVLWVAWDGDHSLPARDVAAAAERSAAPLAATTCRPATSSRTSMLFSTSTSSVTVSPVSRASAFSIGRVRRRRSLLASACAPSAADAATPRSRSTARAIFCRASTA